MRALPTSRGASIANSRSRQPSDCATPRSRCRAQKSESAGRSSRRPRVRAAAVAGCSGGYRPPRPDDPLQLLARPNPGVGHAARARAGTARSLRQIGDAAFECLEVQHRAADEQRQATRFQAAATQASSTTRRPNTTRPDPSGRSTDADSGRGPRIGLAVPMFIWRNTTWSRR